jgi:hypothetical protein
VILHLLRRLFPPIYRVALRAVGSHLPAVYVRVAIRAILPHIRKHPLDVALRALHFLVQPAQWIFCFVVVEFRYRANWLPTRRCVAIFARNRQRPVRAPRPIPLRGLGSVHGCCRGNTGSQSWGRECKKGPKHDLEQRERKPLPPPALPPPWGLYLPHGPNQTQIKKVPNKYGLENFVKFRNSVAGPTTVPTSR